MSSRDAFGQATRSPSTSIRGCRRPSWSRSLFPGSQADWLAGQPQWKRTAHQGVEWCRVGRACRLELRQAGRRLLLVAAERAAGDGDRIPHLPQGAGDAPRNPRHGQKSKTTPSRSRTASGRSSCPTAASSAASRPTSIGTANTLDPRPHLALPEPDSRPARGIVCWILLWNSHGRWLIPLGLFAGFLVGYRLRREAIVTIRFRRCREHSTGPRLPSLRVFRRTLIIGVGDRKVWRRFYHGERDSRRPFGPPRFLAGHPIGRVHTGRTQPRPELPHDQADRRFRNGTPRRLRPDPCLLNDFAICDRRFHVGSHTSRPLKTAGYPASRS